MTPALIRRGLQTWFGATALFLLLDFGLGLNMRIAFLDAYPGLRLLYYAGCFILLALVLWRPGLSEVVGAAESLLNLVALIVSMALRVLVVSDEMIEQGTGFVTMPEIVNFVLVGGVAWLSWQASALKLKKKFR